MYYAIVAILMFGLPVGCIGFEILFGGAALSLLLIGKWYVFWAVGWRLLLAGIRQILQPAYTARKILGLREEGSLLLVRELGFANVAIGCLAVLSLFNPAWLAAAALVGGIFYAMAGINHVFQAQRNRLETVAMTSDLFAAAVLLSVCGAAFSGR